MTERVRTTTMSALFLFLVAHLPTAAAEPPGEIPFTTGPRGHLIVEVSVDERGAVPFVLDTGAGRTVVNRDRLGSLGLTERASDDVVQGAHESFSMGLADVESLMLGEARLETLELGVMDLAQVESPDMPVYGVLGYDVFGRWDVEIDLVAERVTFHPRGETESTCAVCAGDVVVPFELNGGTHIEFEVVISEQPITAILDTGSGRTGMNSLAAKAIGIDLPPSPPGAHGPALRIGELHLGDGVLAKNLIVGVVDLPVFEQLGISDGPTILVGTGALEDKRIGIAYGLGRLSVSDAASTSDS